MNKFLLTLAMVLLTANSWAGTSALDVITVSRTLTLTSPSAALTMNGASATAFLRNVSVTGVLSATTVSASNGNFANISATQVLKAWGSVNAPAAALYKGFNVSSVQRVALGRYGVSFTTPLNDANYALTLGAVQATGNATCITIGDSTGAISPTIAGFRVFIFNCSSGGAIETSFSFQVAD